MSIIKATLTNTKSEGKLMGEISESFERKTGLRQADGLYPLLFNYALEKDVDNWRKEKSECMSCNTLSPKYLHSKYVKNERVPHFKYLEKAVKGDAME